MSQGDREDRWLLSRLTARLAAAYVSRNPVAPDALGALIKGIAQALSACGAQAAPQGLPPAGQPAVPIEDSIQDDFLVCLEDGKELKLLKRYLMVHYGLTPEAYRRRWDLPADYPMVAPGYAARRRQVAIEIGLGRRQ